MTFLPDLERTFHEAAARHELREGAGAHAPATEPPNAGPSSSRGRRRPRWRLPVLGGGALVALGAAAAIAVVGLPGGHDELSFVEEASAALAPRDGILYLKMSTRSRAEMNGEPIDSVGQAALTLHTEQWSTTDPRRHRYVVQASKERARWNPEEHVQPHTEFAWAGGAETSYDADRRSMRTITGLGANSSASYPPALVGKAPISLEQLRAALASGRLAEQGRVRIGGREAVRLVGDVAQPTGRRTHLTYDVDPVTYAPRRIIVRWNVDFDRPHIKELTSISTITVERYEQLPLTPANEELLTIHPPAGTRIRVQTLDEVRAGRQASDRKNEAERRARAKARDAARATPRP